MMMIMMMTIQRFYPKEAKDSHKIAIFTNKSIHGR
jgi:hypothetical protein